MNWNQIHVIPFKKTKTFQNSSFQVYSHTERKPQTTAHQKHSKLLKDLCTSYKIVSYIHFTTHLCSTDTNEFDLILP